MATPTRMHRLLATSYVAVVMGLSALVVGGTASARENVLRPQQDVEHGSQGATSEWLPIVLGGTGGMIAGGLIGAATDPSTPAVAGPILGAGLGIFTGGAAGAWGIRQMRQKDTRLVGTLTGLGLGLSLGTIVCANVDPKDQQGDARVWETIGKWSALVVFPVVGAFAARKLAISFGSPAAMRDDRPTGGVTVIPVIGAGSAGFVGVF